MFCIAEDSAGNKDSVAITISFNENEDEPDEEKEITHNDTENMPTSFSLYQNFPNPFNPQTTIQFSIPNQSNVALEIYDIAGKKVKTLINERLDTGFYTINWDGKNEYGENVSSGIYFYILKAGNFKETRKMLLNR